MTTSSPSPGPFDFGIAGYRPRWLRGPAQFQALHGARLRDLVGRRLVEVWLMWRPTAHEVFTDGPVVLDLGSERLEINHQKMDEVSITWNSIDLSLPIRWPCPLDDPPGWRRRPRADVARLCDAVVTDVEILQWTGPDLANGTLAVHVRVTAGHLVIWNALDEVEVGTDRPDPRWRPLAPHR